MDIKRFSRDEIKKHGKNRLINSFIYAFHGIKSGFEKEQNMTLQVIISIIAIIIGLIIGLSRIEWIIVILLIGLVLASELINTSIEATLDVAKPEIDPVVKIAKDTAAAAVLIFCVMAVVVGLMIFVPNIIYFIQRIM